MTELQEVLIGGDFRLVGEQHDNGGKPVAAPLTLPHQPLFHEAGDRVAAGLADELQVGGVTGPLLEGRRHAALQHLELFVLVEARPAALGAPLHFGGVNRGGEAGADGRRQHDAGLVAGGQPPVPERRRW